MQNPNVPLPTWPSGAERLWWPGPSWSPSRPVVNHEEHQAGGGHISHVVGGGGGDVGGGGGGGCGWQ